MSKVEDKPRASSSRGTDQEEDYAQIIFLMLLDDPSKRVLLFEEDGEWYLPYYQYPYESAEHKADACLQLQKSLGFDRSRPYFTAVFDPLGFMRTDTMNGDDTRAYSHLLLVEPHCIDYEPQLPAAWHDIKSVLLCAQEANRLRGPDSVVHEVLFDIVQQFLKRRYKSAYLNDVRFRPDWFRRSSQYLKGFLADIGVRTANPVFQHSLSSTSTILKVDSDRGIYFLKTPATGSDEVAITRAIAQQLPNHTLRVVGTNDELNCFVSECFELYEDEDPGLQFTLVDKLAEVQIESITCLEELQANGLPDRSPRAIVEQIDKWLDKDTTLKEAFASLFVQRFVENADAIKKGLMEIDECGIPLTLVHGDARFSNFAYRCDETNEKIPILYDWQFSCISHPFFDFHLLHEDFPPALAERYLQKWTTFAPQTKLRRAFKLACIVGWMIKFWVVADNFKACCPETVSVLHEFLLDCLDTIICGLRRMHEKTVCKASDTRCLHSNDS